MCTMTTYHTASLERLLVNLAPECHMKSLAHPCFANPYLGGEIIRGLWLLCCFGSSQLLGTVMRSRALTMALWPQPSTLEGVMVIGRALRRAGVPAIPEVPVDPACRFRAAPHLL